MFVGELLHVSSVMYVAVWCSLLQCAAMCCNVLQCVAIRCSVLQCVAVCCSALQCLYLRCRVFYSGVIIVCCSALQCVYLSIKEAITRSPCCRISQKSVLSSCCVVHLIASWPFEKFSRLRGAFAWAPVSCRRRGASRLTCVSSLVGGRWGRRCGERGARTLIWSRTWFKLGAAGASGEG